MKKKLKRKELFSFIKKNIKKKLKTVFNKKSIIAHFQQLRKAFHSKYFHKICAQVKL